MIQDLSPSDLKFLTDWGIAITLMGIVFTLIGVVVGWIIWKNHRRFAEFVESGNRDALADYERTSDEMSRIKAELYGASESQI